jgi:predicted ABC-type ATPase
LLHQIIDSGGNVSVYYVGLESVGLHIDRVQQRVAHGGHDIPEEKIRSRYRSSFQNLASLLPKAARVELFDNSAEGSPRRVAVFRQGDMEWVSSDVPEWARLVIGLAFE